MIIWWCERIKFGKGAQKQVFSPQHFFYSGSLIRTFISFPTWLKQIYPIRKKCHCSSTQEPVTNHCTLVAPDAPAHDSNTSTLLWSWCVFIIVPTCDILLSMPIQVLETFLNCSLSFSCKPASSVFNTQTCEKQYFHFTQGVKISLHVSVNKLCCTVSQLLMEQKLLMNALLGSFMEEHIKYNTIDVLLHFD